MSDDQLMHFIRDEFSRLHDRLDEHFTDDHKQDAICNQLHSEWRLFKWSGSTAIAAILAWLGYSK